MIKENAGAIVKDCWMNAYLYISSNILFFSFDQVFQRANQLTINDYCYYKPTSEKPK